MWTTIASKHVVKNCTIQHNSFVLQWRQSLERWGSLRRVRPPECGDPGGCGPEHFEILHANTGSLGDSILICGGWSPRRPRDRPSQYLLLVTIACGPLHAWVRSTPPQFCTALFSEECTLWCNVLVLYQLYIHILLQILYIVCTDDNVVILSRFVYQRFRRRPSTTNHRLDFLILKLLFCRYTCHYSSCCSRCSSSSSSSSSCCCCCCCGATVFKKA